MGPRAVRGIRAHGRRPVADALRAALGARSLAVHQAVLADEITWLLAPPRGGWVIDGTVGMGGHAGMLLERGGGATRLLGLDVDPVALGQAGARLEPFGARATLERRSFRDLAAAADDHGIDRAAAILLDLGLSSWQLDASGRGFTFQRDEPLDMRLDPDGPTRASDLVNTLPEDELAGLLVEGGDERHARTIARAIVRRRPMTTTGDLVAAVRSGVPRAAWPRRIHVATRTFQAIRRAVNDEGEALGAALDQAPRLLAPGGRLGIVAFHSGEDRAVKRSFQALARTGEYAVLEPAPMVPSSDEVSANPRARSAKLRVLERLP